MTGLNALKIFKTKRPRRLNKKLTGGPIAPRGPFTPGGPESP